LQWIDVLNTVRKISVFVTFSSDNAGLDKNSWGNEPVCKFYTDENSIYNFSFHETAGLILQLS
jgi:type IV secretory pathway VirB4 component